MKFVYLRNVNWASIIAVLTNNPPGMTVLAANYGECADHGAEICHCYTGIDREDLRTRDDLLKSSGYDLFCEWGPFNLLYEWDEA